MEQTLFQLGISCAVSVYSRARRTIPRLPSSSTIVQWLDAAKRSDLLAESLDPPDGEPT